MKLITFIRRILFGWKTAGIFLIPIAAFCNVSSVANATTITFEPGEGTITVPGCVPILFGPFFNCGAVQYVEAGMTMDATNGIFELGAGPGPLGQTSRLQMFTTDHAPGTTLLTVTFSLGGAPFDLTSALVFLDSYGYLRSSLGGALGPAAPAFPPSQIFGTIDFTQLPGWSGITSFTMFQPRSSDDVAIAIDNIVFQPSAIPEPSTLLLLLLGMVGLLGCRRRELTGESP